MTLNVSAATNQSGHGLARPFELRRSVDEAHPGPGCKRCGCVGCPPGCLVSNVGCSKFRLTSEIGPRWQRTPVASGRQRAETFRQPEASEGLAPPGGANVAGSTRQPRRGLSESLSALSRQEFRFWLRVRRLGDRSISGFYLGCFFRIMRAD